MKVPHVYQEKAIQQVLDVYKTQLSAVNGSDMGTGKTLQAVEVMLRLDSPPTLVVAPKATLPSWRAHAQEQGSDLDAIGWEMVRTGRTPYGTWHADGEHFLWDKAVKFLVFDEVHRAMGRETKNSQLVRAARQQGIRALAMSATIADTPLEMDSLGYLLRLHDGLRPKTTLRNLNPISFNQWTAKHGCGLNHFTHEWEFGGTPEQQAKHMAKINALLYPHKGCRVRIDDLGDQFPDQQITAELYDIEAPGRMDALYAQMAESLAALHERAANDAGSALTALLRAQQEVELLKVPVLVDQTRESIDAGRSVVLFVKYRQTINELCQRLNTDCFIDGTQTGDAGAQRRETNRLRFVNDDSRQIIAQVDAGGAGLDLGDMRGVYPRTTLASPGFNAKGVRQLGGRTRRDNSKSKSLVRFVFAAGTCEVGIHRALTSKLNNLDALNDADLFPSNLAISRTF